MARIRTIKPEFFCHEELFDLEDSCGLPLRLAFAGLWTVCDRDGRFVWRPRTLKAQVMPHDAVDFGQVLDALERGGFVQSYVADGVKCGFVPSWKRHQIINTRESASKIPPPPHEQDSADQVHARACASQGIEYRGVNIAPALRETILARDGGKCCRCGATDDMTVDHIFPQSMGGTHAPQNLRAMCRKCNSARPVAGKALIDDLAKDGFTLDDMQRTCMHMPSPVHAQGEGKGKEGERNGREGVSLSVETEAVVDAWNKSAATFKVKKLTSDRAAKLRARLKDPDWPWRQAIAKLPIPNTPKFDWQPDFDWLIANERHAYKLAEGTYDRKHASNGQGPGVNYDPNHDYESEMF